MSPGSKPLIKAKIEEIARNPSIGKRLERELSGYLTCRVKRYRIIFQVHEEGRTIEIHCVGRRKDVYELFEEQIRRK